ncbi:DNA polymerase III subunit gamma/tau [Candidatus Saccharibacteria bacterium]|nr:DNA polymerase III subunit gamma/tau [Candidatus Saccharibacteria bacterium]
MNKALYRKYRPCRLSDVVGQEQTINTLKRSLEQGRISHAYLFVGPRGTGKTSVARIFAHEINNFKYEIEDDYVDIIEIDGASNRGIDDVRELREKALIAPTSGKYKIYIIDEVHMLTREAFNALLKTLEEPPSHVIFIMATTEANKVPVTITSRSQIYTFRLAEPSVMFDYLKSVADKEKIKITDEALEVVVKRGGGSFRDSLSLLDQISTLSEDEITKDVIISALGLPSDEKIAELLETYLGGDMAKITTGLKDLLSSGIKAESLTEEMINYIISNPKPELLPLLARLPEIRAPFPEAKLLVALTDRVAMPVVSVEKPRVTAVPDKPSVKARVENQKNTETPLSKEETLPPKSVDSSTFSWEEFLEKAKEANEAIYLQLVKSEHELSGNELHIYPSAKISEAILNAKNNKAVLSNLAGGFKVMIHDNNEKPKSQPKDAMLDKISGIMGGEVKNDGGENPF